MKDFDIRVCYSFVENRMFLNCSCGWVFKFPTFTQPHVDVIAEYSAEHLLEHERSQS